jgi:hypothetical protein
MENANQITREDDIEATMAIFGLGRFDATELVAIGRGESLGDCVGVDANGHEYSLLTGPVKRTVA